MNVEPLTIQCSWCYIESPDEDSFRGLIRSVGGSLLYWGWSFEFGNYAVAMGIGSATLHLLSTISKPRSYSLN